MERTISQSVTVGMTSITTVMVYLMYTVTLKQKMPIPDVYSDLETESAFGIYQSLIQHLK